MVAAIVIGLLEDSKQPVAQDGAPGPSHLSIMRLSFSRWSHVAIDVVSFEEFTLADGPRVPLREVTEEQAGAPVSNRAPFRWEAGGRWSSTVDAHRRVSGR